ncbi:lysophospholipid acyltransferase family protein [Porphyromonas levii]|uniref:lysophospholipid acyltransferase family protein n=1 Tax=Porphyromonas levii TaxID=28114 RepID=UPI001B8C5799|nr:lysophospholipid acyltransferase family protein [Porphyromonas levii]MBR8760471.1 Lipid A biosynthesis lauroyltransferase [Porphyromonas levii]MBR8765967.1 Lipid A biosynthesis lauroyltransferase [Porphyromonas levii]
MKAQLLYTLLQLFGWLPSWWHYAWSWGISYILQYIVGYRREVIQSNLRSSFSDKSPKELRALERAYYRHLSDLGVEIVMLTSFSKRRLKRHVRISNSALIADIHADNPTLFFLLGHYGNWEWFTGCQALLPMTQFNVVYKHQNGIWNEVMSKARSRFGARLIEMNSVPVEVLQRRKEQGNNTYIFVSDQNPSLEHTVLFTNFLHRPTATITGMERLANLRRAAVVYIDVERVSRGQYLLTIKEMTRDASQLPKFDLSAHFMQLLEQSIERQPEIWLWSHRRWKIDPQWVAKEYPDKEIVMR